ncbi:MAG: tRNA (adenosine(37)-N6)-threonylcarbamoyltransferase complex transferase subunit TsaD [Phycisphaerales bacterium]|nr:tRNA (adenosine(37)-N6)-threonylcarbamoyltransferase complex transferase subunit TsaD [Phycisphaerales bacterium]
MILGIETSCDETAAAVVRDGRDVLSSVVASQDDLHAEYRGVVPEIASRAHAERVLPVVRRALADAGVTLAEIDAVAVGHRPGLIGSLLVGVAAAKGLAWSLGRPLIGVDHVHAHLYAGLLGGSADVERGTGSQSRPTRELFPALGLVVSGGHTALYRCESPIGITRLGGTIDDAIGEAYDKAAAILGLPYPGGPNLDRLAASGNERAHDFPVSRLDTGSLDFSFSGLKTAVLYAVRGVPGPGGVYGRDHTALDGGAKADLAASFQRAAVAAITLKVERALASPKRERRDVPRPAGPAARAPAPFRSLLVGGGVSANSRLRRDLTALCERHGLALRLPPMAWCVDNAAMIAGLGHHLWRAGRTAGLDLAAVPTTAC